MPQQKAINPDIAHYRGYEITIDKQPEGLYYRVKRMSDGIHVIEDYTTGDDSVEEYEEILRNLVDEFIDTEGASQNMEDLYHTQE